MSQLIFATPTEPKYYMHNSLATEDEVTESRKLLTCNRTKMPPKNQATAFAPFLMKIPAQIPVTVPNVNCIVETVDSGGKSLFESSVRSDGWGAGGTVRTVVSGFIYRTSLLVTQLPPSRAFLSQYTVGRVEIDNPKPTTANPPTKRTARPLGVVLV